MGRKGRGVKGGWEEEEEEKKRRNVENKGKGKEKAGDGRREGSMGKVGI